MSIFLQARVRPEVQPEMKNDSVPRRMTRLTDLGSGGWTGEWGSNAGRWQKI